jgi:hypothetical protein
VIFEIRFTSTLFDFDSRTLMWGTLARIYHGITVDPLDPRIETVFYMTRVGTLSFVNYRKLIYRSPVSLTYVTGFFCK